MSAFRTGLSRLMATLPAILLITFVNVFICFTTAGMVLVQLLASNTNRYVALGLSILVAVGVHLYIVFNHKIRDYIKQQGSTDE